MTHDDSARLPDLAASRQASGDAPSVGPPPPPAGLPGEARQHTAVRVYASFRSAFLTIAALVGVISALAFAGALVFGLRPLIVASGSMEPAIPVGSVVFTKTVPASVPLPGDIVTVQRPRNLGLITHRLVSSQEVDGDAYEYVLRGDANSADDPERYLVTTAGQYTFHVAGLGYVAHFLQIRVGQVVGLAAALLLISVFVLDPARFGTRGAQAAGHRSDKGVAPDEGDHDAPVRSAGRTRRVG